MTGRPSAAQARLLGFLAHHPVWITLVELDQIRLLETDDVLCVPSLVERGWLDHRTVAGGILRITPVGRTIAAELSWRRKQPGRTAAGFTG